MPYNCPEGTADLLPASARLWQRAVSTATKLFSSYGYEPIETPLFELTEVFTRGIGEATDVVNKEMFVVRSGENYKRALAAGNDDGLKSKQRLALRPEGTAGTVRAVVQHNLVEQGSAPAKLFYYGPMFRAERPQKGRLREFHQIGAECLGSTEPSADAEMIIMLMRFYEKMGVPRSDMRLLINSMGDDECRPAYREMVRQHILDHADEMCEDCQRRAETNPLRAFDCKKDACKHVMESAPIITDHLCDDCRSHYEAVKKHLDAAGIEYIEDPTLVRGLDYYTRTVFEIQSTAIDAAQSAIGGGGRYDKLAETVGGRPTPGLGFALGFERMVLALEAAGALGSTGRRIDGYIACVNDSVRGAAFELLCAARDAGLTVDMDHQGKSLKAQFKIADRLGASTVVILGPDELAEGKARVRDMGTHAESLVDLDSVKKILLQFNGLEVDDDTFSNLSGMASAADGDKEL
ncbi:histidine--tRNA ligase [Slackia heliotrinireducens]|uniref:histidine--tRNA ligase n=1 Tax=Slackia heliotrinireducens TaxID=84110 RepID=UPI0033157CCA